MQSSYASLSPSCAEGSEACPETHRTLNCKLEQQSKTNFLGAMYFEGKLLLSYIHGTKKENNPIKTLGCIENTNKALL